VTAVAEVLALAAVLVSWAVGALSLPVVALVYAAKWTVASGGQLLAYHLEVRPVRWRWSPPDIALLVRTSWPILLASMLFFVPLSAGVVLVRLRAGPSEAALFGLAYQVANAYQILGALVVQVVQPHIYGVYGLHRAFLARLGAFAALFLGGLGLLALAGARLTVVFLLPPFYRAALWAMPWLLAAAALLTVARLLSAYLLRLGEERFIMGAHLATALLYVGACLAVPVSSVVIGAAVIAPCAALLGVVACWWRVRARLSEAPAP
jgi:O-antigen/teichoic acid export membrane protein